MPGPLAWVAACAAGFLLGSIPSGLLWGRALRGIDVRRHGSGNLGATNVYRVLGPAHGISVLLLDVVKGGAAVFLAGRLTGSITAEVLAGLLAVLGHMFTPWAGFRGGKGVATGLGIWLFLAPAATAITLGIWGIVLALTRRVSAASLVAVACLVAAVSFLEVGASRPLLLALATATAALVWARHVGNIQRLARGKEPPLWGSRG